ncbi:hypothetical protein OROGR_015701 [Orobanche gracilis]
MHGIGLQPVQIDTLKNLISRDETYAAGNVPQKKETINIDISRRRGNALSKSLEDDDDQLSRLPKCRTYHYSS